MLALQGYLLFIKAVSAGRWASEARKAWPATLWIQLVSLQQKLLVLIWAGHWKGTMQGYNPNTQVSGLKQWELTDAQARTLCQTRSKPDCSVHPSCFPLLLVIVLNTREHPPDLAWAAKSVLKASWRFRETEACILASPASVFTSSRKGIITQIFRV